MPVTRVERFWVNSSKELQPRPVTMSGEPVLYQCLKNVTIREGCEMKSKRVGWIEAGKVIAVSAAR